MATTPAASVAHDTKYEVVIGLEVHVQLATASKAFCSCSTQFGAAPNTHVCPVCLAMPGSLPVFNRQVAEFATLASMALNCRINETSIFARKNYFYPDLPKGYQISQFDKPIAEFGYIDVETEKLGLRRIGVTRLHIEEDAGKSMHDGALADDDRTSIDLNRSGTPLCEIVSEPDLRSPEEAYDYLTKLREIILYTGVSDCNMEEGSLRCDANISLRPWGQKELGQKVEIKNVNSFRYVRMALEAEIERQTDALENGEEIKQETRLYNVGENKTYAMRSKEKAHDYRYFPEPDLLPLVVDAAWQAKIRAMLPELPAARRARMIEEYGVTANDAGTLTQTKTLADSFEEAARAAKNPKRVANIILSELLGRLKAAGLELEQSPISMKGATLAADLLEDNTISTKILKELFDKCFERKADFAEIYEKEKPQQISDAGELESIIDGLMAAAPKQVESYRAGKTTVIGFFVGGVMKATHGKANPAVVNQLLTKKLNG